MKTFDIALEYLKEVDFSPFDPCSSSLISAPFLAIITTQHEKFLKDKRNTESNENFRSGIFEAALHHLSDKSKGITSYWDVACTIVESNRNIIETKYERWHNTIYPKKMYDHFADYCKSRNCKFLSDTSEMRDEFFMAAYHYIIDNK